MTILCGLAASFALTLLAWDRFAERGSPEACYAGRVLDDVVRVLDAATDAVFGVRD